MFRNRLLTQEPEWSIRSKVHPVLPTRVSNENINDREELVKSAFITIRAGLMQLGAIRPEYVEINGQQLEDIKWKITPDYNETSFYPMEDGWGLSRQSNGGLVDYAHRLKVPTKKDTGAVEEYKRISFNEDPQTMSARTIDLKGIKEISRNETAVAEILVFERDIVYHSMNGWFDFAKR